MDEEIENKTERITILIRPSVKARYDAALESIGIKDRSERIRSMIEDDLSKLEALPRSRRS